MQKRIAKSSALVINPNVETDAVKSLELPRNLHAKRAQHGS